MRRRQTTAASALIAVAAATILPASHAAAAGPVPFQYIAKVYTEALGRAPDQSGWANTADYFGTHNCDTASLKYVGKLALTSTEFTELGYGNPAKVLVAYRTVLNREVDTTGYAGSVAALDGGTLSWSSLIDQLYASSEFTTLRAKICSTATPDYEFGTTPATIISAGDAGFTGTQSQLQALLNSAAPGSTLILAQRAVVRLSSTLSVPAGVTLGTAGSPGPNRYADQGRLVRANVWPTFAGPAVTLQPGAKMTHVWVDGQMGIPTRHLAAAVNVRVLSGTGSAVTWSRLGNTVGNTALSSAGGGDALPDGSYLPCVDNEFSNNLVEAYSSDHTNGNWADGVSVGCEDATITGNQVVDASDVPLIIFGQNGRTQHSQMTGNTAVNAGQGAYASLGLDPWLRQPTGDGPGVATRDFTGANVSNNAFWNTPRSPNALGIAVGTRAWTGGTGYNGHHATVQGNSTGSVGLWAGTGIAISGMLNTTVTGNTISLTTVAGQSACPLASIGAALAAGYASGTIQSPTADANYYSCIVGMTE